MSPMGMEEMMLPEKNIKKAVDVMIKYHGSARKAYEINDGALCLAVKAKDLDAVIELTRIQDRLRKIMQEVERNEGQV